ncbi:hypothetical protein NIES2104_41640 [Leptolyngbya sp. NIES-2104]|nr:hypothetical protein NIES2104_41640 [Leptolyngbya sp. NIES-2104]
MSVLNFLRDLEITDITRSCFRNFTKTQTKILPIDVYLIAWSASLSLEDTF